MIVNFCYYDIFNSNLLYSKSADIPAAEFWLIVQDNYLKFSHDFCLIRGFLNFERLTEDYKQEKRKKDYTYAVFSRKPANEKFYIFNCIDKVIRNKHYCSRYVIIQGATND